jgi:hypothetical protein
MKKLRYFAIGFVALGLVVLAASAFRKHRNPTSKPFTLVSATYIVGKDGTRVLASISTKFVRDSAVWREVTVDAKTQQVRETVTKDGNIYEVVSGKLEWVSKTAPTDEPEVAPTEYYTQLARTEKLFGLTTYVTHMDMGDGGWEEEWHALETGSTLLKIHLSLHEGKSQRIVEPLSLTFGDIPDSILNSPELPISFDRINALLKAAEKAGHQEYVDQMKANIEEEKKKNQQ